MDFPFCIFVFFVNSSLIFLSSIRINQSIYCLASTKISINKIKNETFRMEISFFWCVCTDRNVHRCNRSICSDINNKQTKLAGFSRYRIWFWFSTLFGLFRRFQCPIFIKWELFIGIVNVKINLVIKISM